MNNRYLAYRVMNVVFDVALSLHVAAFVATTIYFSQTWAEFEEPVQQQNVVVYMLIWLALIAATFVGNWDSKNRLRNHLKRMNELDELGAAIKRYRRKQRIPYYSKIKQPPRSI